MYTIILGEDNALKTTIRERIMQRSSSVDSICFLVEPTYKDKDMSNYTVTMEYLLPISKKYCVDTLVLSDERRKEYLQYFLPIDSDFTNEAGRIEVQLTFSNIELSENGECTQYVRKTSKTNIDVFPVATWSDVVLGDFITIYDANNDGVVDDSERFGGKLPDYYAKAEDIPSTLSELENDIGYITKEHLSTDYALKEEIPTKISELDNDIGYLTEHQSLEEYIKTDEAEALLKDKADLVDGKVPEEQLPDTEISWDDIPDKPNIPTKVGELENDVGYLTEHQSLDDYAKSNELPTKVSQLENDAGYLTEHQNLDEYAKTNEVETLLKHKAEQSSIDEVNEQINGLSTVAKTGKFDDLSDIPSEFNPKPHTHNLSQIDGIEKQIEDIQSNIGNSDKAIEDINTQISDINKALEGKENSSDIEEKLNKKSDEGHNHDDRYLTEQETRDLLVSKQDKLTFDTSPTVNSNNPVTSGGVRAAIDEVVAVAQGKCKAYVFDYRANTDENYINYNGSDKTDKTVLEDILANDIEFVESLNTGDVLLIRDICVPDYWWDKNTNSKQILETTKVDLTEYVTITYVENKLKEKADSDHNHDDRYYLKVEVNDALDNKVDNSTLETFETEINKKLDDKVNKVEGSRLITEDEADKLDGIEENANNYTHPDTHHVDIIVGLADVGKTGNYSDLNNIPKEFTPSSHNHPQSEISGLEGQLEEIYSALGNKAEQDEIPTKVSQLENDKGYLTEHQSLDEYAKTSEVSESLNEVENKIPTKTSDLQNDSNYLTSETDPTVPSWAKEPTKPIYTASEVGADASGTANNIVLTHNTETTSHNDIRLLIADLITKLNNFLDVDDTTVDQLSELIALINANTTDIKSITSGKVSVSDIINNLTTNVTNKPLSAAQGVALKTLIDAITIPTKVSELANDANYLTSVPAEYITETELNSKGYATTSQIPTIPSSLPANGGNADTIDNYHIRKASKSGFVSNGVGWIEFVV